MNWHDFAEEVAAELGLDEELVTRVYRSYFSYAAKRIGEKSLLDLPDDEVNDNSVTIPVHKVGVLYVDRNAVITRKRYFEINRKRKNDEHKKD